MRRTRSFRSILRRARVLPVLIVTSGLVASGCSKTAPSPVESDQDFTGTLAVMGADVKTFTVNYADDVSDAGVTVNSLTTVANGTAVNVTIGVAFGTPAADGSCDRFIGTDTATIGTELVAAADFNAGAYCVQIYDVGTLTEPVNYSITVRHF